MIVYFGWGLLAPVCLSLIYGYTSSRALDAMGYPKQNAFSEQLWNAIPPLLLFTLWGMVNFPLPLLYLLSYSGKLTRLLRQTQNRARELFLINLTHLMTMALHMVLIGVISLAADTPMDELLNRPFWRIATIAAVLAVNILIAWLLPRWGTALEVFRTQSESEEVRPFMVFLWFCNIFLLVDSVLCMAPIDWRLLPLFLIGSTALLEFYLIRFLMHIYSLLKVHFLEDEHRRLMGKLEQQNREAAKLRSKIVLDPMTGIFSRKYIFEQAEFLLKARVMFSLVFIDLDHLKQVNDREGHHAGDLYLIQFAREFGKYLRKADIFARVGGDEFVVLLPDCPPETAAKRMEAIRGHLTEGVSRPISFSYGVSSTGENAGLGVEELLRGADREMYRDKQLRTGKGGTT